MRNEYDAASSLAAKVKADGKKTSGAFVNNVKAPLGNQHMMENSIKPEASSRLNAQLRNPNVHYPNTEYHK
ncbi:hypothetical protein [Flammeovirga agarivorans]|uniref:Uncharacterized protein n=1 Tax=Flammeovirga agarivorans TaxID=2726742 RepID=A0A7X8SR56_9BACT|nr:hypothetical protein [Flammeovirga agarivorans]NLR94886.1 hypothetical protein [Flammeovirga agarivorans]